MSTVTYLTGTYKEFEDKLNKWYFDDTESNTMVFTFEQKELMYKWKEEDIADLAITGGTITDELALGGIEYLQNLFTKPEYEEDVVISCKVTLGNPTNPEMIKWNPEFVEDNGYVYIIATRVSIDF